MTNMLVIPDAHAHPDYDNDRFDWLGKYIVDLKPDVILCLGDFADMPSLSSYDKGTRCVDKDTEFLTTTGWKKISEYSRGDFVAVYDTTDEGLRFEQPKGYVEMDCPEGFYNIKTTVIEMRVTPNHRLIYKDQKGNIQETLAQDMVARHESLVGGWTGRFITTFNYDGGGLGYSESMLRVLVAFKADGSITSQSEHGPRASSKCAHKFSFKREEKIARIKTLLDEAGLEYRVENKDYPGRVGFTDIYTHIVGASKRWDFDYSRVSKRDAEIIIDEMLYWDGCKSTNAFSTTHKQDADFMQFCFAIVGQRAATLLHNNSAGYNKNGTIYRVKGSKQNLCGIHAGERPKVAIDVVPAEDGKAYCFTTSTGTWLSRRNGRITVQGNSFEGRRYKRDVEASVDALVRLFRPLDDYNRRRSKNKKQQYSPRTMMTVGNHEARIDKVTQMHPELHETISVDDLGFSGYFNEVIDYKGMGVIEGFATSHYFVSGLMGRPIGGERAAHTLLTKQGMSCIAGHSHLLDFAVRTRADGRKMMGLVAGWYGHPGMKEGWNANTAGLWWNGVTVLHGVKDGWAEDISFISQETLRKAYDNAR